MSLVSNNTVRRALSIALFLCLLYSAGNVSAQSIKIGRFDFVTVAGLDLIYSTNVEQEPELASGATEGLEREDYYYVARLELSSFQQFDPNSILALSFGLSVEKHFVRDDLDTLTEPFGDAQLEYRSNFGRYQTSLRTGYRRQDETQDDTFISSTRKRRDVNTIINFGAGVLWEYARITVDANYDYTRERHEDEEFQDNDKDEQEFTLDVNYEINSRLSAVYEFERSKTDFRLSDGRFEEWEDRHFIGVDIQLIEDPDLRYKVGFESEDDQEEDGEWELIHTFTLDETYDFTDTITLTVSAEYTIEDDPEEDDQNSVFSIRLDHTLDIYASQSFTATREPRDTFGSNQDTDSTTYDWRFSKEQFFVRDLTLSLNAGYDIDKPVDSVEERTKRYGATLSHDRQLTRKLYRSLQYIYDYEDSNVERPIEEHRVELSLEYTF